MNNCQTINNYQQSNMSQLYYTIMVDGKQVHKVKNSDPRTFDKVKVYAGDRFHRPANAAYMNLAWETNKGKYCLLYTV